LPGAGRPGIAAKVIGLRFGHCAFFQLALARLFRILNLARAAQSGCHFHSPGEVVKQVKLHDAVPLSTVLIEPRS